MGGYFDILTHPNILTVTLILSAIFIDRVGGWEENKQSVYVYVCFFLFLDNSSIDPINNLLSSYVSS